MKELYFRSITSIILISILYFSYLNNLFFFATILVVVILSTFEFLNLFSKVKKLKKYKFTINVLWFIYLLFIFYIFIDFNRLMD